MLMVFHTFQFFIFESDGCAYVSHECLLEKMQQPTQRFIYNADEV